MSCVFMYLKFCMWKVGNASTGSQHCGAFLTDTMTLRPCCCSLLQLWGKPQGSQTCIYHLRILRMNRVYNTQECMSPVCMPHFLPVMILSLGGAHTHLPVCVRTLVPRIFAADCDCTRRDEEYWGLSSSPPTVTPHMLSYLHICRTNSQVFFLLTPTLDSPPPPSLPCADLLPTPIIGDERPQ